MSYLHPNSISVIINALMSLLRMKDLRFTLSLTSVDLSVHCNVSTHVILEIMTNI